MQKFGTGTFKNLDHIPDTSADITVADDDQIAQLHNEIFQVNRRQLMQAGVAMGSAGMFGFVLSSCKSRAENSGLKDASGGTSGPGPKFQCFVDDYKNWITNLDKIYGQIAAQTKAAEIVAQGGAAPSAQDMQDIAGQVVASLAPFKFFTLLGGPELIAVLKETILDTDSDEDKKRKAANREKVVLRGKLLGKLISDWLAFEPYRMFKQLRDPQNFLATISDSAEQSRITAVYTELGKYGTIRGGIFQPIVGPALITKNEQVRHVLQDLNYAFTVKPYFTEMRKAMKGQHKFFILGTDNKDEYENDAIFLKGKFSKDGFDEELKGVANRDDLPLIKKLCRDSVTRRVKKMIAKGPEIDAINLSRYVPVDLIGSYFGVYVAGARGLPFKVMEGKLPGQAYQYSDLDAGPFDGGKLGEHLNRVFYKVDNANGKYTLDTTNLQPLDEHNKPIPSGNPNNVLIADFEIMPGQEQAAGMTGATMPDEEVMYQWLKNCFQNFFNNFQKEEQVQLGAVHSGFQVMSLIAVWIQAYKVGMEKGKMPSGAPVPDNMITRLIKRQKADPTNTRLSDTRIRENVFGIIAGAIINQEEQTARTIDALADLCNPAYTADGTDGEDYFAAGQTGTDIGGAKSRRAPYFDATHKDQIKVLCRADDDASYTNLRGYYNEAMRHRPQGEVLLRQQNYVVPVSPTSTVVKPSEYKDLTRKLDGVSFPAGQMVFVCQGSAMKDTPDSEKFITDREERKFYIHHGVGRHRCLGQYISPLMTIESMRAIFAYDTVEKVESLEMDARGLYATKLKLKVSGNVK